MTMPAHPNRNIADATPRALFVFEKFKEDARQGSAALAWRTAKAIVRHAAIESVTITHAMNQLLYAGELR